MGAYSRGDLFAKMIFSRGRISGGLFQRWGLIPGFTVYDMPKINTLYEAYSNTGSCATCGSRVSPSDPNRAPAP